MTSPPSPARVMQYVQLDGDGVQKVHSEQNGSDFLRMDRLRRSLRDSFRKKKEHVPECSKPHQWQADEAGVRAGTCNFPIKYLGCVEVFESRGMQVCEEALKMLRNSRRRPVKGVLYVTGDGLRVVDDDTKGLIVDQTIEKVSFCAPDRNHEKGFSYICRDGTTRRWMCHGFLAVKDSGERLSHAVGCAFAACLERKQKRDKECGVTMTFDPNNSTFTRMGSFRQTTMTERMQDPQDNKVIGAVTNNGDPGLAQKNAAPNPFAIERPHATPMMLQRQGSFRGFTQLNQTSPFKRQMSLRLNDLPSNLERQQRSLSLESSDFNKPNSPASPQLPPREPRTRLHSLPNTVNMSPIPESSPVGERQTPDNMVAAMCQQLAQGLTIMSNHDDLFSQPFGPTPTSAPPALSSHSHSTTSALPGSRTGAESFQEANPWSSLSRAEVWLASNVPPATEALPPPLPPPSAFPTRIGSASVTAVTKSTSNPVNLISERVNGRLPPPSADRVLAPPRRAPHIAHLRSQSLGTSHPQPPAATVVQRSAATKQVFEALTSTASQAPITGWSSMNGNSGTAGATAQPSGAAPYHDPFDAEWAALSTARGGQPNTNPFAQNSVKAFEVHM